MNNKCSAMKNMMDNPARVALVRDRLLAIYYISPLPIKRFADEVGINATVADAFIKGKPKRFSQVSMIKLFSWVLNREEALGLPRDQ